MLILGDLALTKIPSQVHEIKALAGIGEHVLLNLEGALLSESDVVKDKYENIVFNSFSVFSELSAGNEFIFGLSNNHIFDAPDLGIATLEHLRDQNLLGVGAWAQEIDFSAPLQVMEGGKTVSIISAGWDVIGCLDNDDYGVNQLRPSELVAAVTHERKRSDRVVVYLHWGYELEVYPHPADRKLAHDLIDAGADIILGSHAHCILGHERYKNKNIFYGLGNFAFSQGVYFGGRIKFPDICRYGLCIKYCPEVNEVSIFGICNSTSSLIDVDSPLYMDLIKRIESLSAPFNLALDEYSGFFKKNRRKKKMLPIFLTHDQVLGNFFRKTFLKCRGVGINLMFHFGLKGGPQ